MNVANKLGQGVILMKKIVLGVNVVVMIGATLTLMLLSYQGLGQQNAFIQQLLAIFVSIMDYGFILATILHFLYYKTKFLRRLTIVNGLMIIGAYILLFAGYTFHPILFFVWDWYLFVCFALLLVKGDKIDAKK